MLRKLHFVGACRRTRKAIFKSFCVTIAFSEKRLFPLRNKQLSRCGDDRSVIENLVVNDGAPFDEGRHQHRRHSHTEPFKIKRCRINGLVTGVNRVRRRHMIVKSAVFVISDHQQRAFPPLFVFRDRLIDIVNNSLAQAHVVIGMLIRGAEEFTRCRQIVVARLDKAKRRQFVFLSVFEEVVERE